MILYTCGQKKALAKVGHACGRAALALDEAGYEYELRTVKGYRGVPWQRLTRKADRAEIIRLSGVPEVPILVLDDRSRAAIALAAQRPVSGGHGSAPPLLV